MAETEGKETLELQGVINEIAEKVAGLNGMKEKQEEMQAKIAAFEEAQKRGFQLPQSDAETEGVYCGFSLAHQGKALVNKYDSPKGYHMTPEVKNEVAKVLLLFVKGGLMQDPFAAREYKDKYRMKTPLGDTGNVFPVPEILETEILHYAYEKSLMLRDATVVDMISSNVKWPIETSLAAVAWGNTTGETEPGIDEVDLLAEELSAYSAVRNTQLADARSDIVGWLLINMATAVGMEIDRCAFVGNTGGTTPPSPDPFDGICSAYTSGVEVVTMGAGERFVDLNDDYFSQAIAKLVGLRKQGAQWYLSGAVQHFVRQIKDSVGSPIFMPENIASGQPGTIYGYPMNEAIKMNATDGASAVAAIFGNPKQFYIGRRLDSTALIVDPYGLFTTNRTRFKIYQRWAMKCALPAGFVKIVTGA